MIIDFFCDFKRTPDLKIKKPLDIYKGQTFSHVAGSFLLYIHASESLSMDTEFIQFIYNLHAECTNLRIVVSTNGEYEDCSEQKKMSIYTVASMDPGHVV